MPTTPNNVGCCWPTICYVRLHGPKSLTGFKLYGPTSAKKCQYCCRSMQTDATSHNIVGFNNSHNIVGFNNVGSVCMGPPLVYLILQRETNFLYDYIQMTALGEIFYFLIGKGVTIEGVQFPHTVLSEPPPPPLNLPPSTLPHPASLPGT